MSVTERLMIPAGWSLNLIDTTPPSVLEAIDLEVAAFGHIIITPTHVPASAVTGATLLTLSRYTGIYRERPSHFEIGGPGLEAWLGDEDGKGDIIESTYSISQSFVAWVTALNTRPGPQLVYTVGTFTAIPGPGNLNHSFRATDRRTALQFICDFYGAEWRVTPSGVLDAGPAANLFTVNPTSVVQRRSGGRDLNITGIMANLDLSRDFDDYTTRVFLTGATTNGTANISPATPYYDLKGIKVEWTRAIDSSDTVAAHVNAVAQAQLNRFTDPRKQVKLSTDTYDIGADIGVGDNIYVYDPELGLVDTANEVYYRGETIHPVKLRCYGVTWPVQQGMGVYFRSPTVAGEITDLTDYIDWDTGYTEIDVGAQIRPLGLTKR